MIDLNKRIGFWSLRVWGLILNFAGNALAIYGAVGFINNSSRLPILLTGCGITLFCILILAQPVRK
ncbi:hypothetical protein ACFL5P_03350 [candidate division KSB1 bacterium]